MLVYMLTINISGWPIIKTKISSNSYGSLKYLEGRFFLVVIGGCTFILIFLSVSIGHWLMRVTLGRCFKSIQIHYWVYSTDKKITGRVWV